MDSFLSEIFGSDIYLQIVIIASNMIEVFATVLIFNIQSKKKNNYLFKVFVFVMCSLLMVVPLAYLRNVLVPYNYLKNLLHSFYSTFIMFLFTWVCLDASTYQKILTFCGTNATMIFAGKSYSFLLNVTGIDDKVYMTWFPQLNSNLQWLIYFGYHVIIYVAFAFLFQEKDSVVLSKHGKINVSVLTVFSLILTDILFSLSEPIQNQSLQLSAIVKAFACILCIVILVLKKGILSQSKKEEEALVMNNLFQEEKKQFDSLRTNIDVINSKCHDLRHQLNSLEGKVTSRELDELKEATRIYDSTIKTGYDALDAIIYEKQLVCEKENIRFTCLCDGKAISFIDEVHLYALLTNAISNAIEASKRVVSDKRIVDLTIRENHSIVFLEVSNYYEGDIRLDADGLPMSTKTDGSNHGYGTKSISYIVSQYGGELNYSAKDNIFRLLAYFPREKKA